MRSGPAGIFQIIILILYGLFMALYPIAMAMDGASEGLLSMNMFLGMVYCILAFLYSGYYPMVDNSYSKGVCYTFIRSAHFMPFTKADYVTAAVVQWIKYYLIFIAAQAVSMIVAIVRSSPAAEALGAVYFQLDILQLIMGIVLLAPIAVSYKMSVKNSLWYMNMVIVLIGFILFGMGGEFFSEELNAALGWYCSVWGIIGGIAVIPIVAGAAALMFRARKSTAWFRG